MERLTKRLDLGLDEWEQITYAVKDDLDGLYNILDLAEYMKDNEMRKILIAVTEKLADYEDTGLTPEEIKNIKECQSNIVKFVTEKKNLEQKYSTPLEMYDKKQKELETWKRDAIESKAKLGEIRIKFGLGEYTEKRKENN